MLFNSLTFVVFLAIVIFLHSLPFPWRVKKWNLWVASYLFYAAWNPPFVLLLWISTLTDWVAAKRIAAARRLSHRRLVLIISLCVNLGMLGYFKYGGWLLDNFIFVLEIFNIRYQPIAPDVVLPVGISFYTFQSLSYTLDVYRQKMQPWESFSDFALFVAFFPQLVAGPIVRAADFLPQCATPKKATARQLGWGLSLMTIGLFQKIILADTLLAPVSDTVYAAPNVTGFRDAWIGTLAFSGQIFFDFAGYSNCAIGAALCLGFDLPDNFRFPYAAIGFSDFWRRWHISLSSWLRDYLYISLGGNRQGTKRTQVNVMLTMLIGGLWHGASWRFVAWGGLHGTYLLAERALRRCFRRKEIFGHPLIKLAMALGTYFLVCFSWVFFRAGDFTAALMLITAMFGGDKGTLVTAAEAVTVLFLNAMMFSTHWALRNRSLEAVANRMNWRLIAVLLAGLILALALAPGDDRAFIYFQF